MGEAAKVLKNDECYLGATTWSSAFGGLSQYSAGPTSKSSGVGSITQGLSIVAAVVGTAGTLADLTKTFRRLPIIGGAIGVPSAIADLYHASETGSCGVDCMLAITDLAAFTLSVAPGVNVVVVPYLFSYGVGRTTGGLISLGQGYTESFDH